MLDRSVADNFLYRVAIVSLDYYPTKPIREPGYTIDEDLDYCLDALPSIPDVYRERMRERLREVIQDPTRLREAFCRDVTALVTPVTP